MNFTYIKHCKTLGVKPNDDELTVKKAYHELALKLHPDTNDALDAHERFVEIKIAYDYILDFKAGKIKEKQAFKDSPRAKTTHRRRRHKVNNEEDTSTPKRPNKKPEEPEHELIHALNIIMNHVIFVFPIAISVSSLVMGIIRKNWGGILFGVVMAALVIPMFRIRKKYKGSILNYSELKQSLVVFWKTGVSRNILLFSFHVIVFLNIINHTVIHFSVYMVIVSLAFIVKNVRISLKGLRFRKKTWMNGLMYALNYVHLFFVINYFLPVESEFEVYRYYNVGSPVLRLEGDAYSDYPGMRIFFDQSNIEWDKKYIQLKMETGVFRIRVLRDYEFVFTEDGHTSR